jgi:hypothetical protein
MRRSETIYARHLPLTTLESFQVGREAALMTQQLCVIGKADLYAELSIEDLLLPRCLLPQLACAEFFQSVIGCGHGLRQSGDDELEERANAG